MSSGSVVDGKCDQTDHQLILLESNWKLALEQSLRESLWVNLEWLRGDKISVVQDLRCVRITGQSSVMSNEWGTYYFTLRTFPDISLTEPPERAILFIARELLLFFWHYQIDGSQTLSRDLIGFQAISIRLSRNCRHANLRLWRNPQPANWSRLKPYQDIMWHIIDGNLLVLLFDRYDYVFLHRRSRIKTWRITSMDAMGSFLRAPSDRKLCWFGCPVGNWTSHKVLELISNNHMQDIY
jgi:hypothetical protein